MLPLLSIETLLLHCDCHVFGSHDDCPVDISALHPVRVEPAQSQRKCYCLSLKLIF